MALNDILKSFSVFEYKFSNNSELNVTSNILVTNVNQNVQTEKLRTLLDTFSVNSTTVVWKALNTKSVNTAFSTSLIFKC